ncbi:MAG TPA: four helix bundle protein [Candidatus Kapabacteria bacterium]|nr:four helix bundle protein [Candidatus Kapabacteria bacterium]
MTSSSFEHLDVYRLAERLSDTIWDVVYGWPSFARATIGRQIVDAADSISANIAEGVGRWYFKDNQRCVRIARGSLFETRNWLRRAYRRKLLTREQIATLTPIIEELIPRLNAYLKSIGRAATIRKPQPPYESSKDPTAS